MLVQDLVDVLQDGETWIPPFSGDWKSFPHGFCSTFKDWTIERTATP